MTINTQNKNKLDKILKSDGIFRQGKLYQVRV